MSRRIILFTGGKRYIHLASRDGSRFVRCASIKGQCARHKFYGSKQVEDWLSHLESYHGIVYRAIIDIAWNACTTPLSAEEDYHLREAILLQRTRTPGNARLHASSADQMLLYTYCKYLKALPTTPERQALIEAIQRGKATVKNTQILSLMHALHVVPHAVTAISDLSLLILRNHSTAPFIMGDAPCVFSNHYMRGIPDVGALGFVTPGLMAVLPIDARTQVLFYDAAVYTPHYSTAGCVDVFRLADISILNAMQIYSAEENVYFSDVSAEPSVRELLSAHRRHLQDHRGGFVTHSPSTVLINDVPNTREILRVFEPQLPITLNLSFISTASLAPNGNLNRVRDPALARQLQQALGRQRRKSPISIDELARWIESEIRISEDT